jgi:hypothetical protein
MTADEPQQTAPAATATPAATPAVTAAVTPMDLFQQARALLGQGTPDEAAAVFRRALELRPGYGFFTRTEKFLRQLRQQATEKPWRKSHDFIVCAGAARAGLARPY